MLNSVDTPFTLHSFYTIYVYVKIYKLCETLL